MSKYICSKLASDNAYTTYNKADVKKGEIPRKDKQVLIKGGTGVAGKNIMTPHGVITEVSDEQLKLLEGNKSFQKHKANGFVKVLEKNPSAADTKKVAADLSDDKSAPLTPEQLKKEGKKAGKTGKSED